MIQIDDVSPVSSNTSTTGNPDDGSAPFQSVNGRMLTLASSPDGQRLLAGSFSNLWSSLDDGQSWDQLTWPQPQSGQFDVPGALGGWCVVDIAVSPVDGQTILVITRNDRASSDHGIWRSTDGGGSWTSVHQFTVPGSTRPPAAGQLAWVAGSGRLVFAAGGSALAVSQDGGASFQEIAQVGPINHVAVSLPLPSAPLRPAVYALGSGVMFVSLDGGGSWTADAGPIQANWGGAVSSEGNAQAPSVLVVSPRSPLEVFLIANANGGKTVSPLASASLFASVYHFQHHFTYPDIAGTIWDSWWDGDRWNVQQLNGPGGKTPSAPSATTGAFATVYHDQHHFAYLDAAGTIWDSWWDGDNDQWKLQQINGASGVTPNGPPAVADAFVSVYHDQHHFAYRDSAGTIWDSWWNGNSWQLQQINAPGGNTPDGPAAADGPFVTVYHDQHHFAYLDAAGTIWDSWWNGSSWQLQQINAAGGKTPDGPAAVDAPFVSVYHNQHHFAYRDSAGTIWDSWWDGSSWRLQQINAAGGKTPEGPASVDRPFVTVYHNQHHFAYRDSGGTVWDSWWNADTWQLQQINAAGGKTPDGPAATVGPFVSVYKNQHHFSYLDGAGTIFDSWWDGDNWQLQQINGGPVLWRGDYSQFANTGQSTWQRVVPPDLNEQDQDSGRVFIAATRTGHGDLLFYGAQRTKPYVGPLDPASPSDWKRLDDGNSVHPDLHGIFLSPDFKGTIHHGNYQWQQGSLWLLCDGGIYRSTDGGKHFKPALNLRTLACVNVAGLAIAGKTALSLNTGDNDGFFSGNGGAKWISQDYGGGDNDCSFADPLRPHSMLVFTPRWDPDGNPGAAADGQTVTAYETTPGELPDVALGTDGRHVVPGPSLDDKWNASSSFALRGFRPIVFNLPQDDSARAGDYIFVRFKAKAKEAVLLRTQKLLEIDSRDDWDTVATGASDGARVFQQGPALPSTDMGVVQASGGHTRTVFYAGGNQNNELWKFAGGRTDGPAATDGPFATVYHNQHHFPYADAAGTIWDPWWDGDNDQWKLQQINGADGKTPDGPPAVEAPFVTVYHDQHHFAYRDSAGTVWDSWWNGNSWQLQQINAAGGKTPDGPAAVDAPFVSIYHDQHHFAYRDSAGTIWDSWWNGNSWQLQQINAPGGKTPDGPAAADGPFVTVYHDQHHFAYLDAAGTIWDSWWNGSSWQLQQINAAGGKTPDGPAAVDAPFVSVYHNQHHFAYRDSAGTIWDSWWDGNSWRLQQINAAGGKTPEGPASVDRPFVTVYHNQHHFAYRDSGGTVWDSWWNADTWQLQQINAAGGKTPEAPAAEGGLFVSLYHDQHHFTYRDGAGAIWDSWWNGDIWQLQQLNEGTWQQLVPSLQATQARRFFVSPYNPGLVYILDIADVKRSDDGGNTWQTDASLDNQLRSAGAIPGNRAPADFVDLVLTDMQFDPADPLRRFAVGLAGAFFTTDGVNWDRLLDTLALPGRPTNCYYDSVSDPSSRALYVAFAERSLLKISPLP